MKIYIILLMVCIISVNLCSCSCSENITYIEPKDGKEKCLLYQEKEYYPENVFIENGEEGKQNQGDVEIGMYYSFPFGTKYYSYTTESPDYIYSIGSGKDVYLKKGFDYRSEVFLVDEICEPFVFSDALTETKLTIDYMHSDVVFYSQKYPNLKINAQLFFDNNNWYLVPRTNKAYLISPSLLQILQQNKVI